MIAYGKDEEVDPNLQTMAELTEANLIKWRGSAPAADPYVEDNDTSSRNAQGKPYQLEAARLLRLGQHGTAVRGRGSRFHKGKPGNKRPQQPAQQEEQPQVDGFQAAKRPRQGQHASVWAYGGKPSTNNHEGYEQLKEVKAAMSELVNGDFKHIGRGPFRVWRRIYGSQAFSACQFLMNTWTMDASKVKVEKKSEHILMTVSENSVDELYRIKVEDGKWDELLFALLRVGISGSFISAEEQAQRIQDAQKEQETALLASAQPTSILREMKATFYRFEGDEHIKVFDGYLKIHTPENANMFQLAIV